MQKRIVVVIVIVVMLLSNLAGCTNTNKSLDRTEFDILGTVVTVKIFDNKSKDALDEVFARLREIESRMSVNIEDSDISNVNRNAGIKPYKVHEDVYYVLQKAKYYAQVSDGAYDPTIGPLVKLWGIGTEDAKVPDQSEIDETLKKIDYNKLELLDDCQVFLKDKGMAIDLGGIAKGYAADEARKILKENNVNSAIIDLGGNVYVIGNKPDGTKWNIGIQNPFEQRNNQVGIVSVSDKSVVSSGDYERYFEKNDKKYHHILDTKTGYPADNMVSGVSIITDSSIDGDALSTTLFVLGVEKGLKLANSLENIEIIYITKDFNIYKSSGAEDLFELINKNFTIVNL